MDSCQLFNFLFGSKKAGTELNRCFASMRKAQGGDQNISGIPPTPSGSASAPPSPLKQIQTRLANLASSSRRNVNSAANSIVSEIFKQPGSNESSQKQSQKILEAIEKEQNIKQQENLNSLEDKFEFNDDIESDKMNKRSSGCFRATLVKSETEEELSCEDNQDKVVGYNKLDYNEDEIGQEQQPAAMGQSTKPVRAKPECEASSRPLVKHRRMVLYEEVGQPSEERQNEQVDVQTNRDRVLASARIYGLATEGGLKQIHSQTIKLISGAEPTLVEAKKNSADDLLDADTSARRARVRNLVQSIESQLSMEKDEPASKYQLSGSKESSTRAPPPPPIETSNYSESQEFVHSLKTELSDPNNNNIINDDDERAFILEDGERIRSAPFVRNGRPVTLVKHLPPKTPPKSNKAKCLNLQLSLNKPLKIEHLLQDDTFLRRLFAQMEPLDRCLAAQVCRKWRDVLYADRFYWKDLVNVIDCTQLRREHIVDCIISTLQSARLKNQRVSLNSRDSSAPTGYFFDGSSTAIRDHNNNNNNSTQQQQQQHPLDPESIDSLLDDLDQEDVWRIQELCNRYNHHQKALVSKTASGSVKDLTNNNNNESQEQPQGACSASKSSSIPSQISSTLSSSHSLSLMLSPLSESNRIDSIREKLYCSIDNRGFDAICLFGATDDDIHDLAARIPSKARQRILVGRLTNCCITDRGLDLFIGTFDRLEELELSGCNEISNSLDLRPLVRLRRLIITDCINIADGIADKLVPDILGRLEQLTVQAYHLTDAFVEYLCINAPPETATRLTRLELPNCKEITNHSLATIATYLPHLEALSISGSTRICDDGIEMLTDKATRLSYLDLSWCSQITDSSLECIACYLSGTLTDLILDRNAYITDLGLEHLGTMNYLKLLHIRWCSRITDKGLSIILRCPALKYLSLAGLQLVTAEGLASLAETDLHELELTNCSAVSQELILTLSCGMPKCNIIV